MADNTQLNVNTSATGATNVTIAADEIAGVLYQRIKVTSGDDGTANDVGPSNPMPVTLSGALAAGDNNIGNVDVLTLPALVAGTAVIGKVGLQAGGADVTAGAGAVGPSTQRMTLASDDPAVAALVTMRDATNTINVAQDTSTVKNGATSLTPKFAVINLTATGDLVALVSGKQIRVLDVDFICSAAQTVTFTSGTGPTAITGPMSFAANGGLVSSYSPIGKFQTAAGAKLAMTISGAGTVAGWLVYVEV